MPRRRYPSDLTDVQWTRLEPLLPGVRPGGRPRAHPTRDVIDALRYVLRGGSAWRALPMTTHPGRRSITTSAPGASTAPGSGSTMNCARWCGNEPGATGSRVRPSWIANRPRRQKKGASGL